MLLHTLNYVLLFSVYDAYTTSVNTDSKSLLDSDEVKTIHIYFKFITECCN